MCVMSAKQIHLFSKYFSMTYIEMALCFLLCLKVIEIVVGHVLKFTVA